MDYLQDARFLLNSATYISLYHYDDENKNKQLTDVHLHLVKSWSDIYTTMMKWNKI